MHGMSQDPMTSLSLGTRWFQKVWTPTTKLEESHQQEPQEDRDWMGRGTGVSGGQAELVESCSRPNASLTQDEPGTRCNYCIQASGMPQC